MTLPLVDPDDGLSLLEPVEVLHVRDHAFVKRGKRGCGADVTGPEGEPRTCGRAKLAMCHVGTPASLNVHGSGANRFTYQTMKVNWSERLIELLEASGLPRGLAHVHAEGVMSFPDAIRRDQGNYRFILEKALGDALQAGGWLEDDDWDHYEFGRLQKAPPSGRAGRPWTQVTLHPSVAGATVAGVPDLGAPDDL